MSDIPGYVVLKPEYVVAECNKILSNLNKQIDKIVEEEVSEYKKLYDSQIAMNKFTEFFYGIGKNWQDWPTEKSEKEKRVRALYAKQIKPYKDIKHSALIVLESNGTSILVSITIAADFDLN